METNYGDQLQKTGLGSKIKHTSYPQVGCLGSVQLQYIVTVGVLSLNYNQ